MWATLASGIGGLLGGLFKPIGNSQMQGYTPEANNTGIYLAIAAVIIALIVIILIFKA